jgi:predicted enzyme related to lactoylglutathione lyase
VAEAIALEHVGIPTTIESYQATIDFYTRVFGWEIIRQINPPLPQMQITFIGDGRGGRLEIFTAEGGPMNLPAHLAFAVQMASFDGLKARLEQAGIVFDTIMENPAGDKLAFFRDPAGNSAQVCGRITPLP